MLGSSDIGNRGCSPSASFNCFILPFGGKSIILVGDFNQLPNPDDFLPECLLTMAKFDDDASTNTSTTRPMAHAFTGTASKLSRRSKKLLSQKYGPLSLVRRGCDLFAKFERYHLTEQHRSNFPRHMQFITDLSKGNPITINTIENLYKPFTNQTVRDNPEKWQFAPFLVASNRERINITYWQCFAFTKAHNTHVYHWCNHFSKWKNAPLHQVDQQDACESDPVFWQYFVAGADALLTSNISTQLDLANRTFVILHLLTFANSQDEYYAQQQAQLQPPGSVITLENPPFSVNVIIVQPSLSELQNISNRSRNILLHHLQVL